MISVTNHKWEVSHLWKSSLPERAQVLSGRKYAEAYLISMYNKIDSYVFGEMGINSFVAQYIIGLRIKSENLIFSNDNDQKGG